MEQTPIEKVIAELKLDAKFLGGENDSSADRMVASYIRGFIEKLSREYLPYEKKRDRNIAEKAWDASEAHLGQMFLSSLKLNHPDKQTYLNQKHPL